ncbi:uncharacterized protein LOC108736626 [Agrilus planipennis]|uniref:Uncharacterized protein LOC108736626 n=1 Tax=Agrilus planipennis TaxID=224129 RepID=A0A1W4WX28_AGRPL|nr:uncharacterized protein LOC108736626 [Agrilus planipennis]
MFEISRKFIGVGLTCFGILCILQATSDFNIKHLSVGNVLFISGLACVIGLGRTLGFFFQSQNVKASLSFFAGIIVVLAGWPSVGMLFETYGFILLFSEFFPVLVAISILTDGGTTEGIFPLYLILVCFICVFLCKNQTKKQTLSQQGRFKVPNRHKKKNRLTNVFYYGLVLLFALIFYKLELYYLVYLLLTYLLFKLIF